MTVCTTCSGPTATQGSGGWDRASANEKPSHAGPVAGATRSSTGVMLAVGGGTANAPTPAGPLAAPAWRPLDEFPRNGSCGREERDCTGFESLLTLIDPRDPPRTPESFLTALAFAPSVLGPAARAAGDTVKAVVATSIAREARTSRRERRTGRRIVSLQAMT